MGPQQQPVQEVGGGGASAGSSGVTVVNPGGTVNTLPKFTAPTVIGDSHITDTGTNVTINSPTVVISDGTGQVNYKGGAKTALSSFSSATTGGARTGLLTDYIVQITETTTNNVVYTARAMGAAVGEAVPIIVKDVSYSGGAVGLPNTKTITVKPLAGKKLNNVVNGTLVILNSGGIVSVFADSNDDLHQLGFTP